VCRGEIFFFVVYQQCYDSLGVTDVLQPLLIRHPHTAIQPAANDLCLERIQAPREQDGSGPRFPGLRQLSIFPSHEPLTLLAGVIDSAWKGREVRER
jgi:hypothetical protein